MLATIYNGSGGPKPIAGMTYHNIKAAHAKLIREEQFDRQNEIDGLAARLEALDAEYAAKSADGSNMPPEPTPAAQPAPAVVGIPITEQDQGPVDPFGALKVHFETIRVEVGNWADGSGIENADQADTVDVLIDMVKAANKAAEDQLAKEIAPLTAKVTEARERYYPLIGETKKITGSGILMLRTLLEVKTVWGNSERLRLAAEATRKRDEANEIARIALEASKAAVGDLVATEKAEDLIKLAQAAVKVTKQAEKATPGAGYRTEWVVAIVDQRAAVLAMMKRYPQDYIDLTDNLGKRAVREGQRTIDGFTIVETKVAVG